MRQRGLGSESGSASVELALAAPALAGLAALLAGFIVAATAQATAFVAARDAARMIQRDEPVGQVRATVLGHLPGLVDPQMQVEPADGGIRVWVQGRPRGLPAPFGRPLLEVRAQVWVAQP